MEELWQHRNEVKHEPPKEQPKFSEKKNLSPEELERLGHVKCNACGKILPNKRLLRRHFYSDHREWMPDPICAVCGTEFKTSELLYHTCRLSTPFKYLHQCHLYTTILALNSLNITSLFFTHIAPSLKLMLAVCPSLIQKDSDPF